MKEEQKRPKTALDKMQAELRAKGLPAEALTRFDSKQQKYLVFLPGAKIPIEFTPEGQYCPPGNRS